MEALDPRLLLTADPVITLPNGQSVTTEDFNAGVLPSGFIATGSNVVFDPNFGDVAFSGIGTDRDYLHTEQSDFTDISFIAEVTASLAPPFGGGNPGSVAFFGFGQGTPDANNQNEPAIRSINLRHFIPDLGEQTEVAINYTGPGTGIIDNFADPGPQEGTHRFRFVWDHIDQTAQFLIDEDFSGGTFSADVFSNVADMSGGDVNPANARIFFGGSDFHLFDDFQYEITKGPVDLQIIEENTFVVDVQSQDADGDAEGSGLTYSVDDPATFVIDAAGNLSFVTAPIFDPLGTNIFPVTVTVTDSSGNTDIQKIFVEVEQAGNQPPDITSAASYQVAENNTAVGTISVIDEDVVTFSLSGPDSGLFALTPTSDLTADLTFSVPPNFETPGDSGADNVYDLVVTTEDVEGLTDDIAITVTVVDINEPPTFTISPAQSLEEGDFSPAVVVTFVDPDAGDSVTSAVVGGADQAAFDYNTGNQNLFLIPSGSSPDFENPVDADTANDYEITLLAEDSSGLTDQITITVNVTNVDENPTVDVPAQDGLIVVPENQALVTTPIVVSDPEDPSSSLITFVQGADAAAFSIVNDELVFTPPANFEQPTDANADNIYEVTIGVQDTTGLSGFRNLTVQVTDVNDAPVIDSSVLGPGAGIVAPIEPEGTQFIASVFVDDDDNDQLFYSVGGTDGALFEISPTGQWSFASGAIPDFENPADANVDNVYEVVLIVSDRPDGDPDQLTDTFATFVTIQDVNEAPVISAPADNAIIPVDENQTAVTAVAFSDPDANESHTFALSGPDAAAFSISPTGVLTFTSAPDFEAVADANANNTYEVTVTVEDSGGGTDSVSLNVPINDVNEAPSISGDSSASVIENTTAIPIAVTGVDVDAGDAITFSLAGLDASPFTVNPTTGVVAFAAPTDFEAPLDANSDNVYEFEIVATDSGGLTATHPVTVTVTNEVDAPTITSPNTGSVAENNTAGGAIVHAVTAVDTEDDATGTPLTFAITGGADLTAFQLSPTGDLSFLAEQDAENPTDADANNVYEVEVTVTDSDGASEVQTIFVTVTNSNEPPTITSSPTFTVSEGTSPIGTVTATDVDDASLAFTITGGADAGLFSINPTTGALALTFSPNFEAPADANADNVYEVEVTVSDAEPLTDSQEISVTVTDTPEPPFFTSFNGNQAANVSVDENTTGVTALTAIDQDLSANLSFTISGGADASFFQVDATTGALSFLSAPDAESPADADANGVYEVVVTVTDLSDGLTDTQTLNVTVDSVNEAPVITSPAAYSVGEGTSTIGTVVVADVDDVTHSFSITGGADASLFAIDANSGTLTLNVPPNFEAPSDANADNVYEVEVTASDTEPLSDSQLITVTVTNTPEPPFFTSFSGNQTASVSLDEGTTAIGSLSAIDQDAAANLSFSITGGADASSFQVDPVTGEVTFGFVPDADAPADADANNIYEVEFTVTDGSDGLTDTQTLLVTVDNVNEPPLITSVAARTVGEGTTNVGPVVAVDPDDSTLGYAITGGADASLFSLNPTTGALLLNVVPNFEAPADANGDNQFELEVTVSDAEPLTDVQVITVTISDTPEPPIITSFSGNQQANVAVAENQTSVAALTAVDPDTNANLVYSISGGADAGLLQVDATTGAVSFLAAPDFESPTDADVDGVYEVAITVTDSSDGLTDTQTLFVTVADANDAPTITSSNTFSVSEGTAPVGTVTATDVDDAVLTFSIIGGADASLFVIDPSSGALSLTISPNFEVPLDADANNQYEVEVSASDAEPLSDSQTVVVVVVDTPEPPFFTSFSGNQQATVGVNENNASVTTLTAIDADLSSVLSFAITGGADAAAFQVDATTGAVSFLTAPNFSTPADANADNVYEVEFTVTDGSDGLTDTQTLFVTVDNINDPPTITSGSAFTISEGTQTVTTVAATDIDDASLTFSITGGADAASFSIDPNTGALSLASPPDFESPADADANNDYVVEVTVSDAEPLTDSQILTVTVTNTSEAPIFTSFGGNQAATTNVDENTTAVGTLSATDGDANSNLSFAITGGVDASAFQVDAVTGAVSFLAAPNFSSPADANTDNVYEVEFTVTDASDGLTDTQTLLVTVDNVNDPPTITSGSAFTVSEGTTSVTTVTATDIDDTTLTYSITGGPDAAAFTLDLNTGALLLNAPPNFEAPTDADLGNDYVVEVTASDAEPLTDSQLITVTVSNTPEAPFFTSFSGNQQANVNVDENTTAVTTLTATDVDLDSSLSYTITGGVDAAAFQVDATTGAVSFVNAPNFSNPADVDGNNVYEVEFTVTDAADGLTDTQTLLVTVDNVNDPPEITSGNAFTVSEGTTSITTVTATDIDDAILSYSITGGADASLFAIDGTTGALTLTLPPNFEAPADADANNDYVVEVTASDAEPLTDSQLITVTVSNTPEAPFFTSFSGNQQAIVTVEENTTAVTTLTATDVDLDSSLSYTITGGVDASAFQVDATTGAVSFVNAPNFSSPADTDGNNVYEVEFTVTDAADGLTDTQALFVVVENVNDPPTITSGGAFTVGEGTQAITTVTATDIDDATLTFSITGGADAGLFAIDPATGALTLIAPPDVEAPADADANNQYEVVVSVSDAEPLSDSQLIIVNVTDSPEAPFFTSFGGQSSASLSVDENTTFVTTVAATDVDVNSSLSFAIIGGADAAAFQIDATTGAVSFLSAPNFSNPTDADIDNVYEVTFVVTDSSDGLTDTQSLFVTVENVNDPPSITSANAFAVSEGTTSIATVTATDIDDTSLTYSISGGPDAAAFSIEPTTGALTLVVPPNFEAPLDADANNEFVVEVSASDAEPLSDSQVVTVTVINTPEAPFFTSFSGNQQANVNVDENTTAVTTLTATDVDLNSDLSYAITGGADAGAFVVDAVTGAVSFATAPAFSNPADAAANNVYEVEFTVTDAADSLTDVQTLFVTVVDVNDPPAITSGSTFVVSEGTQAIATVTATDIDDTALTFAIIGGPDAALFAIDPSTGALSLTVPPNFELPADGNGDNQYEVEVSVSDVEPLSDSQTILVSISDTPESPFFTSFGGLASSSTSVNEGTTAVTTLTAIDADLNAVLSFAVTGGADAAAFQVDSTTGDVVFIAPPNASSPTDANADNVYEVEFTVTDEFGLTDVQTLQVTVADVNDAPVITSGSTFVVSEGTQSITTVTATDIDDVTLTFSVTGGADAALFAIDPSTGALSLTVPPDFESPADGNGDNQYEVEVSVSDTEPLSDSQLIIVSIGDTPESPFFTSFGGLASSSTSVNENTTAVTTLTAIDADLNAVLLFAVTGGADAAAFQVDSTTGDVVFVTPPTANSPADSNADNVYEVEFTVTDEFGLTDVQTLEVAVVDVNDPPVITSGAAFTVSEGTQAITTVTATDIDDVTLMFSITGGADSALFAIDPSTGALSLTVPPNFESPADANADNQYEVEVSASDAEPLSDSQTILVSVSDTGEAPFFTSFNGLASANTSVDENTTAVATLTATDVDVNSILSYVITGGADASAFQIDANTGDVAFVSPPNASVPADADANNIYEVEITVTDINDGLTDVQSLFVTVADVNDPPVITSGNSFTVSEGTIDIGQVIATDVDDTSLTYAITGGPDAVDFSILGDGSIDFLAPPNFESPADQNADNQYEIEVTVSDDDLLSATQTIFVNVTDTPESPFFTSFGGLTSANTSADENATAVTTLTATDVDLNSQLTFSVLGGADASLFQIDSTTGEVSFISPQNSSSPTDADGNNIYAVAFGVTDETGRNDVQSLFVTILDENNAPVVTSGGPFTVSEGTQAVATITAADVDDTVLTFAITGGADAALFTIDPNTGSLALTVPPNFESPIDADANNQYQVEISVSDAEPLSDSRTVTVIVNDTPEPPFFTSFNGLASANTSVAENSTAVATLAATDADFNNVLSYSISGGADASLFAVDAVTGDVAFVAPQSFHTPADANADNVYEVEFTVTDTNDGLTDVQSLFVTVDDANDPPEITSGSSFSVGEGTVAVGTVTAADIDGDALTFSITGGPDAALLTIDPNSGALSLLAPPNFEAAADTNGDNQYEIEVTVSDSEPLIDTQTILVNINDTPESPFFTSFSGAASTNTTVNEGTTAVATLTATDVDFNSILLYTITGGADAAAFQVDSNTGDVVFLSAPDALNPTDANSDNVYEVEFTVSDFDNLTDTQTLFVTVANVNDPPTITSGSVFTVSEGTVAITTVTATDTDDLVLTYSIVGGPDAASFAIDSSSGALTLVAPPNFETPADANADNQYEVEVAVSDSEPLTDTQTVLVSISDTPEAPFFTSFSGNTTASEFVAEGATAVTTLTAVDADLNSDLVYTIVGGTDAAVFQVDSITGEVTFVSAADFENPTDVNNDGVYEVAVRVTDSSDGLTDTQTLLITVTDANDPPSITSADAFSVGEGTVAVATVSATDQDDTQLTFFITGGADAGLFTVDPNTGALALTVAPNFETPADANADNQYEVEVSVSDPSQNLDSQLVTVAVNDTREAPFFTSFQGNDVASVPVAENQTSVTALTATDLDLDSVLVYSISGGADAAAFAINSVTGNISLLSPPNTSNPTDANGDNTYEVAITVTDTVDGLTDTQTILAVIGNVNDPPTVTSSNGSGNPIPVPENFASLITTVTGTDPEDGSNVTYQIIGGPDANAFALDPITGQLSFDPSADFENPQDANADNTYEIEVAVKDSLGTLSAPRSIVVSVTDAADPPEITSFNSDPLVVLALNEGTTTVTTVTAIEQDAGDSFTLSLSGPDASLFHLDATTGQIAFASPPDFEAPLDADADNAYEFVVVATDTTNLTDTQAYTVTVQNVDENPTILSPSTAGVDEGDTVVEQLSAIDPEDTPANVPLNWSITGGADASLFQLIGAQLELIVAPDFESPGDADGDNVYEVVVTATDSTGLTDTLAIDVTATNVLESPTLIAPATLTVVEGDISIHTFTATDDEDDAANLGLDITIVGGADASFFALTADVLDVFPPLDFEANADANGDNVYEVEIAATDSDGLVDSQLVAVTVLNANEPPVITNIGPFDYTVTEGELSVLDSFVASDPDVPAGLTWSIIGPDASFFAVDSNGQLSLARGIDFDTPKDANLDGIYEAEVVVTDNGGLSDSQPIQVVQVIERTFPFNITMDCHRVIAVGTDSADVFELQLGTLTHTLTINGQSFEFDARVIEEFHLGAGAEAPEDTVTVLGTALDDTAITLGNKGDFFSTDYHVHTYTFDEVIYEGGGGDDYAEIFGSDQFDTLLGFSQDTILETPDHRYQMTRFERVDSYGRGGDDYAEVFGTDDDDFFYTFDGYEVLQGPDHHQVTNGFFRVDAYGRGGFDTSFMFDTAGDDTFTSFPTFNVMESVVTKSVAREFERTETTAQLGGNDNAFFREISTPEHFFASGEIAAISRATRVVIAKQFDTVEAEKLPNATPSTDIRPTDYVLASVDDWF